MEKKNRKRTTTITIISTAPRTRCGADSNVTSLTETLHHRIETGVFFSA
jgi:hypothetical protein